jgi:cell division protein FtsN
MKLFGKAVTQRSGQHGGTVIGFMLGLVLGLGVAVVVAIFVTRAPVPFMNKTNKSSDRVNEGKTGADMPDPNKPMYGKQKQATPGGSPAPSSDTSSPTATAPAAPNAPAAPAGDSGSVLGGILSKDAPPPPSPAVVVAPPVTPPASGGKDAINDAIKGSIEDRTTYQLQAGAFKQQEDAESMKAKLSLLGYESRILNAQVNGETLYRVRVGPYKQLDDMNKARGRMAENKIDVTVIKIKPAS